MTGDPLKARGAPGDPSDGIDDVDEWGGVTAGGPQDAFESYVDAAMDAIPEPFREHLGSVAIVIEDEPTPAQLASVDAAGLYGLYHGVPRTAYGAEYAPMPSKISLFRGPLERDHRDPASLERAVRDTLLHEVAHHLGISDARLHELSARGHDGRR